MPPRNNSTSHPVTSNERDSITSVINGKFWGLTACGWGSESGRSNRREGTTPSSASTYQSHALLAPSNISRSHNHNLWMEHPAPSSSSALLPGPCLIFSWCWDFIVSVHVFLILFLCSPFWRAKAKRSRRGGKVGFISKHLPCRVHLHPQSWSDIVAQRQRIPPEVSGLEFSMMSNNNL